MNPSQEQDKQLPWYRQLPAKAAAVVVFLVALTTLAGNLLELRQKSRETDGSPPATVPTPPATPVQPAPEDTAATLRVERIVVEHDGSPGTTDWRFSVLADGEPLFAFRQDDLDDGDGRNVALPAEAEATLHFSAGHDVRIEVRGWRESRLRMADGAPDATGEGQVGPGASAQAIRVAAADPKAGAFVFHFGLGKD